MFSWLKSRVRQEYAAASNVRPPTRVRKYDGHWVIIVRPIDRHTVMVRYEDDRTNSEYAVPLNKLK